nr:hypothetical protein GCM10020241_62370 [Streptoalloteichus tenebrarius]
MSRRRRRDGTPPPRAVPRRLVVPRRPGWFVAVIGLLFLACLLVGNGLVHSEIGVDAHRQPLGGHDQVPASVLEGGPVLDGRRDPVRSFTPPPRTVALTFDDGPDPQWTPQVLDVLRRHGVRGTFMVVGSLVTRHPGLARDIGDSGSELGVHTFTHPDLRTSSDTRLREELSASQLALAGAAGITTYLMRPPYASGPSSLDDLGMRTVRAAGALGFVTVLSDVDSRDWATQDAETIVRHATPERDRGAVVLLHDAGGDRAQTVAALDRLIPRLKDRGYRITTVSDALGLPPANQPAQVSDRIRGLVVVAAVGVATTLVGAMAWLLLATGVLMIARLLLMILLARRHHRRRRDPGWSWGPPVTRPVSVVVPAYNERENIAEVVRALAASDHPAEVVVVDDGSTDGTGEIVSALGLPGVTVVRQPNQGKPAALNTGIAHARHDIVVLVDGDTIVEPSALRLLAQPFADPAVGAVSGNAKVANQRRLIGRWQCIEYVMGFNIDRRVYDTLGCMPTVPGAVGAFRREALEQVGGVSDDTLAEDTDLTIAVGPGAAGASSTRTGRGRGPRRPRPGASSGVSGTGGATARCSRSGSTGGRCSSAARPAGSGGSACRTWRCSRCFCRSSRRSSTSSWCTGCCSTGRGRPCWAGRACCWSSSSARCTPSGWTVSGCGCCGCFPCNRSSTGSSCTRCSSSRSPPRWPGCGCGGRSSTATACSRAMGAARPAPHAPAPSLLTSTEAPRRSSLVVAFR